MKTTHIFILVACLLVSSLLFTACSHDEDVNAEPRNVASTPLAAMPITASNAAQITQIKTFQGHNEQAFSVAFSPDGALLASGGGSADRTVRLWDTHTGESVRVIDAHQHLVWHIAFSPDANTMTTASEDGTLRLWEVSTGRQLTELDELDVAVYGATFTPDGKTLASVDGYKAVKLWDVATGQQTGTLEGNQQLVQSVAISPDGTLLVTGGGDSTVRLWNLSTGENLGILGEHGGVVNAVAFSPDGTWVASAALGGEVTLWNVKTRESQVVVHIGGMIPPGMLSVAFSPDGSVLAFGSMDGTIGLWDMAAGKGLAEIQGHTDEVYGLAFSPDGTLLASAGLDGNVILWGIREGGTAEVVAPEVSVTAFDGSQPTLAASACDGSQAAELEHEFRSATGITVRYPAGWAVQDSGSNTVGIANKAEYLNIDTAAEMPEDVVVISIMPSFDPASMGLPVSADIPVGQILTMMTRVAAVTDVKVGDIDAARVDVKRTQIKLEGFLVGYKIGDAQIVIAAVGAREGQLSKYECTVMKIIENITYPAPDESSPAAPSATPFTAVTTAQPTSAPEAQVVVVTMTPMPGGCVLNSEMLVYGTDVSGLNVRGVPGLAGTSAFYASDGERVQIIGGPQFADELEWCEIRREQDGATGWAVRNYLIEAAGVGEATATAIPDNVPSSGGETLLVRSFPPGLEVYVVPADNAVGSFGESYTTHPDYFVGNTPLEIELEPGEYWVTVSKMEDPIDFRADGEDDTVFRVYLDAQGQVTGVVTAGKSYLVTKTAGHQAIVTALFWPKDQALADFVASLPEENVLGFTDEEGVGEKFLTEIFQTHNIPSEDQPYLAQMLNKTGKLVWYSPDSSQHLYVYFNEPSQIVVDPNVPLPSDINPPVTEDAPIAATP